MTPGGRNCRHGRPVRGATAGTVVLAGADDVLAVAEGDGEWLRPTVVLTTP